MKKLVNRGLLLEFMNNYAKQYLACGGPTSRLEENLCNLGEKFGYSTQVFATPTGVFISASGKFQEPTTTLGRIQSSGINLGTLCRLERLLGDVESDRISLSAANVAICNQSFHRKFYPFLILALAAFLSGFVVSLDGYRSPIAASVCGVIALLTWLVTGPMLSHWLPNIIFRDFLGAFLTLGLAAIANSLYPLSIEAYSIGGLIILVPGLAITTAIAELAEQNLVSGTAKLMQAFLALLSIGLAYLLFQEILLSIGFTAALTAVKMQSAPFVTAGVIFVSISCFGILFKAPPKTLFLATVTGLCGWIVFKTMLDSRFAVASTFLAATVVGFLSLWFGRIFSLPSQVYSVPGIIALLPGMIAFSSFRFFASGNSESASALAFKVAVIAISITFGLLTARIPFRRWK